MQDLVAPIILMLGVGGLSGYFSGKIVQKLKGMALAIGIAIFIIIAFAYTGNVDINLDLINASISNILGIITPLGIVAMISTVPFVASFVAGLFIGYRRY